MIGYLVEVGLRYERLLAEIRSEFPRFRIVPRRRSASQRAIHWALVAVTLGGMRSYLDGYQTALGQRVYVTPDGDQRDAAEGYLTMRHERVHLRQLRRWTLPGMAVLYGWMRPFRRRVDRWYDSEVARLAGLA